MLPYLKSDNVDDHAMFMAQEPRPYRGYLVKPTSHGDRPHYVPNPGEGTRHLAYTGYVIVHPPGHEYAGCNAAPGAVWFKTLGEVKTFIDVLYECGGEPAIEPLPGADRRTRDERIAATESRVAWNSNFWEAYHSRV
jgi:hypothetical protein